MQLVNYIAHVVLPFWPEQEQHTTPANFSPWLDNSNPIRIPHLEPSHDHFLHVFRSSRIGDVSNFFNPLT